MKHIVFTLFFLCFAASAFSQIKVFTDGKTTFGETGTTAQSDIHIARSANPTLRLGETGDLTDYFEMRDQGIGRMSFDKYGASGHNVTIDYNPRPFDNSRSSNFRFFRYTDASNANFTIFEGKNTTAINSTFASADDSYFNAIHGDVAIGVNNPLANYKLHVEGTAYKTAGGDTWAIPSDKRLKKNIKDFSTGLDVITRINPVEYEYNGKCGTTDGDYQIGVLAQDLQEVAPFMINPVTHQTIDIDEWGQKTVIAEEEILTINASSLKWILVNAVKEQQETILDQQEEIAQLKDRMAYLEEQMSKIINEEAGKVDLSDSETSYLKQNVPNPFNEATVIEYKVPANAQNASIEFFNAEGKVLKTYTIKTFGEGRLDVNSVDLPTGVYSYRMIVDNNLVETKQMIKSR